MYQFYILILCYLHSIIIHLYALFQRNLKIESTIPQFSWLCMSAIPSTYLGLSTLWFSPSTLYSFVEYLVLNDEGFINAPLPTDFIPSTSDHLFWDRSLESFWVPWDLQSSVASSLTIDSFGNTSMSPDRWIISSVQPQHIYSHLLDCTMYLDFHYHYRWVI